MTYNVSKVLSPLYRGQHLGIFPENTWSRTSNIYNKSRAVFIITYVIPSRWLIGVRVLTIENAEAHVFQ